MDLIFGVTKYKEGRIYNKYWFIIWFSILQKKNNREYSKLTEQALGPYVYDEIKIDPANGSLPRIVTSGTLRTNNFYTYYELDLVVVEFPV